MIRFRYVTAGVLAGVLTAGVVSAQVPRGPGDRAGRPAPRGGPDGPGVLLPFRQLGLSEAQQQQVRGIAERHRAEGERLREQVQAARRAQQTAAATLPVDESAIRAAAQALATVEADAVVHRAYLRAEIWSVLTPEQQAQATRQRTAREERQGERRERLAERRSPRQGR